MWGRLSFDLLLISCVQLRRNETVWFFKKLVIVLVNDKWVSLCKFYNSKYLEYISLIMIYFCAKSIFSCWSSYFNQIWQLIVAFAIILLFFYILPVTVDSEISISLHGSHAVISPSKGSTENDITTTWRLWILRFSVYRRCNLILL